MKTKHGSSIVKEDDSNSRNRIWTKEQKVEEARKFNLLSNVFMSVALDDKKACQHVLRIITGVDDLIIKEIRTQHRISKITSHDAVLDVFAEDSKGRLYNIEQQKYNTADHAKRTRFYVSMIDSAYLEKGSGYQEMPEVYVIYISETDLWREGMTEYTVIKNFKGTDIIYEDGIHIIYVNAEIDDCTDTARLMQYFKSADPADQSQGELSERVRFLKMEEGGFQVMCEVSDRIYEAGQREGLEKGQREGLEKGQREGLKKGQREGLKKGEALNTIRLICKKLLKSKTFEEISNELEEEPAFIQKLCLIAEKYKPEYDIEKIYAEWISSK